MKSWYVPVAGLALLGSYEIWAAIAHHMTLSQYVWAASKATPFVPFIIGLLMGHLFGKRN